jgi:thioester reductase-like protein
MKSIFLTGASGVVGSALVPVLLQKFDGDVYLLLRARDQDHLQQRFSELLDYWSFADKSEETRLIPCLGDMTMPGLGLSSADYETIVGSCTNIIHCGGVVRMNLSIEEARKAALDPAREILALAQRIQQEGKLLKVEFVSTVGVVGKLNRPLTEELVTEEREFHNTYEQAKAETEEYLYTYMKEQTIPITIHRPSMVVGNSNTGKIISFQVFYHLCEFLSGKRTFGLLPGLKGAKLDIIPSDYVAEVIACTVDDLSTFGAFVHECSGTGQAILITDLENKLKSYAHFKNLKIHVPLKVFNSIVQLLCFVLPQKSAKMLRTLPHFLNYLEDPQEFNDDITAKKLEGVEIEKTKIADYIDNVLKFYIAEQKKDGNP